MGGGLGMTQTGETGGAKLGMQNLILGRIEVDPPTFQTICIAGILLGAGDRVQGLVLN